MRSAKNSFFSSAQNMRQRRELTMAEIMTLFVDNFESRLFISENYDFNQYLNVSILIPSRDRMEVLHIFISGRKLFTSIYMMHVKFYMHENSTELLQNFSIQNRISEGSRPNNFRALLKFSLST